MGRKSVAGLGREPRDAELPASPPLLELRAHCHMSLAPSGLVCQAWGSLGLDGGQSWVRQRGARLRVASCGEPALAEPGGCHHRRSAELVAGAGVAYCLKRQQPRLWQSGACAQTHLCLRESLPPVPSVGPLGWELEPRLRYELQEKRVPARKKEHTESLIKGPANCQGSGLAAWPGWRCYLRGGGNAALPLPSVCLEAHVPVPTLHLRGR